MTKKNAKLSALITLLQDENIKVASLAMEQFLKMGTAMNKAIAEYQEDSNPRLRSRIHQLSSILARRRARREFVAGVKNETISLWEGILRINTLYDLHCSRRVVDDAVEEMVALLKQEVNDTPHLAAFMRDREFAVPEEDLLDVDLYLMDGVVQTKYGAPVLLCALAQHLGQAVGWVSTIVLYEGRFCLLDSHHLLVDPTSGWHVAKLSASDKFHPCARKDVWLGILSQLFLVALVEGQLRDLYHFGDLLTALEKRDLDMLPYPVGKGE